MTAFSPIFLLIAYFLQCRLAKAMSNPTSTTATSSNASSSAYPQILPSDNPVVGRTNQDDQSSPIVSVTGRMNYVTPDTKQIDIHRHTDGTDSGMQGANWHPCDVTIVNGRLLQKNIHKNGFQLVDLIKEFNDDITPVQDFLDTNQVIDDFYPTCEKLLQNVLGPGVEVAKAFDHNIRISREEKQEELKGGGGSKAQVPIGVVHGDYTKISGPKRLQDLAQAPKVNDVLRERLLQAGKESVLDPTMVQEALEGKRRFALINVWRNIDPEHPVQELPLACADAQGVVMGDLRTLSIHYPDRIGQNYFVAHSPSHEWCYFPEMTHNEAMLIKQWDSIGVVSNDDNKENISCFTIHSAFQDPSSPPTARARRSIEVRVAVIWKEGK